MKKVLIMAFIVLFAIAVKAQKLSPEIKAGTTVSMDLDYHGQSLVLGLTVKSLGDVINIDWNVSGTGGTYAMKAKGLESGTKFGGDQPAPDAVTALADDETFMCISKAAYKTMVDKKSFVYSGLTYTVKDNADGFKVDGKAVDATFAATADGKTSLWILNNANYPLTLGMKGNPIGIDYNVVTLK
ncbi:hypothetical protein HQ865_14670 [Mucilaginibacter mali]|uniref:DUF4412 domain-containing protein n=1 Tax=Mucilaginibacter mali TaxID=2740462 RepID=A0A7D4UPR5_9SPHI|nr:hypothetical protein [Mucilaginibacter mali]QKJ30940.1 hypothetical protein HQ865_14670 [Mucilaginibacter mali]